MKAKQKAEYLYNQMYNQRQIGPETAKQCALILVSELIKENLRYDYIPFEDSRSAFYLEVEKELNKL
jgi:hypothetical protein